MAPHPEGAQAGAVLLVAGYFAPKTFAFFVVCGLIDMQRNRPLTLETAQHYFLGNGVLTWLLSPLNLTIDVLTFP